MMDSPAELGGRSPHREEPFVGRKRGGPWVKVIVVVVAAAGVAVVAVDVVIVFASCFAPPFWTLVIQNKVREG